MLKKIDWKEKKKNLSNFGGQQVLNYKNNLQKSDYIV